MREIARFSMYRLATCLVNEMARFCVFDDVLFAKVMYADSAYALFTFSGTPWSRISSQICNTKWIMIVLLPTPVAR